MKVFFAGHAGFCVSKLKEIALKSRQAKRLISYGDPSKESLIQFWQEETPCKTAPTRSKKTTSTSS
jgi:hypothetical protein